MLPGHNWAAKVAQALDESQAMVVLLTLAAVNSPNVRREMEYALGGVSTLAAVIFCGYGESAIDLMTPVPL